MGYITILDVPIAPTQTSMQLVKQFEGSVILHPHRYNDRLERESCKAADFIIAPSKFVQEEITKLGVEEGKVSVIPFGANLSNGHQKDFIKNYKMDGVDFCFAGVINSRKGIEFLLEAWNDEKFENDRLHLCGRLFPEIKMLLKEYRFSNVITPGFVNTSDYFKKCDVYVFHSLLEGSSKSIYEAMNMSMPCIVTQNSGSIIKDGKDGFLIKVADSSDIRNKMLRYKQDGSQISRMGKMAYKNVQKYSWSSYAKEVVDLYKRLGV